MFCFVFRKQAMTSAGTAFFSFSCALPGDPPDSEPGALSAGGVDVPGFTNGTTSDSAGSGAANNNTSDVNGANADRSGASNSSSSSSNSNSSGSSSSNSREDGGWEIQEGGECTYQYALDGGNYSTVGGLAAARLEEDDGDEGEEEVAKNSLLLTGLADGEHELRWGVVDYDLTGGWESGD